MDYSNSLSVLEVGVQFLQGLGFDGPKISIETSKLAGDSLLLTYYSEMANRQVEISYLASQCGRPSTIVVFIIANESKRFSLEDWLIANGKNNAIEFSVQNETGFSERQFIERFCHDFEAVCDQELREILTGKVWQNVHIDWKGYH